MTFTTPISSPLPVTIDCDYVSPQYAAAFLLKEQGLVKGKSRALFIENNTAHAVPILLRELEKQGIHPSDVEYLIVTHIHLDHAGGSYALMQACPQATLLAHPRAAPHLIDPTKLVHSASKVYGELEFKRLYGDIKPIDPKRVRAMADGETLSFGNRTLQFIHTRGHANHHFCVLDTTYQHIYTGDAFGIAYPALQSRGLFIFPSTSPTDFDPTEARLSIEKTVRSGAQTAYLTHFGGITEIQKAADLLNRHLDFSEGLLQEAIRSPLPDTDLDAFCLSQMRAYFAEALQKQGLKVDSETLALLKIDIELNAQGISYVAQKKRKI